MTNLIARAPEAIVADIRAWDLSDIRVLRDLLNELDGCRDEDGAEIDTQAYIDMTSLPSAEIPADIDTSYPVWAVDLDGNALVGDDANEIETLDEIRAALEA